jgi:serine protease Do
MYSNIGRYLIHVTVLFMLAFSATASELPDFTKLVEKNSVAVVNISTTQKKTLHSALPPGIQIPDMPEDAPWGELFKKFFGDNGEQEEYNSTSLGSGFIIDEDGYIITNNHVVKDADEIIVRLTDRREFSAKVIGTDERSDIALLKVDAEDLPVVKLGSSEKLKVGEWVMAIGSPFGFDHSVSVGVVSAMGRSLPSDNYVPFIQTDVAINPGNSGGPLFNLKGEVVGINSQIYSRTGGFMGLSFAIPVDVALDVVKQLKSKGHVSRGWLGILIQDVNRELAESFNMERPMGAVVLKVLPDSPASKAKFKVGDVVVEYNGKKIERSSDLPLVVGGTPVGKKVKVKVIREGEPKILMVTIDELPAEEQLASAEGKEKTASDNRLDVVVGEVSQEMQDKLELPNKGVVVKHVNKGIAAEAGIRRGDIILMINNKKIDGVKSFNKLVKELPEGKSVPVLIQRGRSPVFLPIKIPD